MFDDMLYPAILHAIEFSRKIQSKYSSVGFVSSNCVAAIPVPVRPPPTGKYYPDAAALQHRIPLAVARASAQAVGFTCINCNGIFDSRWSMACHRRHINSQGTPCADPGSMKSLSFAASERADASTGTLCQHPVILAFLRCVLQLLP